MDPNIEYNTSKWNIETILAMEGKKSEQRSGKKFHQRAENVYLAKNKR